MSSAIRVKHVVYPESDGKPMGETDDHRNEMIRHIQMLEDYYHGQNVYVSGDLLVYYVEGDPRKCVVPDAFVVKGISPRSRRIYKIWAEGKVPDVVIETTSRKTRRKDTHVKPALYAQLGVKEYFLFDPHAEYLTPPLQGYRLAGDDFERIPADADGALDSRELQLRLIVNGRHLDFVRLDTGQRLLTRSEQVAHEAEARQREAEARQRETEARQREVEARQREVEARQREAEARQREVEARQRETEARQAAEAEIARLREELAHLRQSLK